jgi:muramoyltetrapeptide carboxypeptidase
MRRIYKPRALRPGDSIAVISLSSPAEPQKAMAGIRELTRLGFTPLAGKALTSEGYFSAPVSDRLAQLLDGLSDGRASALIALRGGYGSTYLLDALQRANMGPAKPIVGYSDITALQIFLWQTLAWVTFYGPMVAAGFDAGAGNPRGYDMASFLRAITETQTGWTLELEGSSLVEGEAEGVLVGGCLTLVETTLGTPWELHSSGAILVLEDRAMKPWQVDRALMHLKQCGKFDGVSGVLLGDFPECEPPVKGSPTVLDVCRRTFGSLKVPVVWGAPVGHTARPMLTLPLGVRARLRATGAGSLDILEPAVVQ